MWKKTNGLILLLLCVVTAWVGYAKDWGHPVDRLSGRSAAGNIAVRAGGMRLPGNAKVSLTRTRANDTEKRVKKSIEKRRAHRGGKHGVRNGRGVSAPSVLAMYDISINVDGTKWQPAANEPVQVTVELDEPVIVAASAELGVVHLADDGTVDELDAGKYGFTYNADKTAVTAFWFSASGFSVYSIVDNAGTLVTARRFYHFYDHPSAIENSNAVRTFPYRYMDQSNDVVNVQIIKDGDMLKEPPVPEDILDEHNVPISTFEGWYVVHTEPRPANAVESKLDSTTEPFEFVWPVGVTDKHLAFTNGVAVAEKVDMDYYVVPLYEHARYLQFNEKELNEHEGGERIIDRKIIALNDVTGVARIKVSDVSAALKNSRQEYFCGWRYLDKNGQYTDLLVYSHAGTLQDEYINIDDELFQVNGGNVIQLWPLYVSAHFLNFDTNAKGSGATYVGSIFLRSTTEISAVTPSGNRPGYDFAGWCVGTLEGGKVKLGERVTDANGNVIPNVTATNATGTVILYTDASGNIRLNKDITLYASWIANTSASYRVIVWQQRVTDSKDAADADKKYFYVTHYTSPVVSATTKISETMITSFTGTRADGTSITSKNLEILSGVAADNAANEDFTGFHYARWACEDATVASDGSTVINVYYDRDLITLRFCLYDSNQSETIYMTTTNTVGDVYGTDDGENYFAVYYDNGQWYKSRTNGYDYYGKRYNRGSSTTSYYFADSYSGNYYTKSGNTYTRVTNSNYSNSTQYYGVENGAYFPIYRSANNGTWYKVQSETIIYAYSDPYSGYRYKVITSHWIVNDTMTGLCGQTLASNGYTWPSERRWYDGNNGSSTAGTQISFLDAFLPTSGGDETYYSTTTTSTSSSNTKVYFYKENLDGSWLRVNEFDSGSSSVNFNISDKYNGFQAYQYSTDGESSWKSVGTYNASTHYYGSQVSSSKLSIRFKRKTYELIYKDGDATVYDTGKNIPYESPLSEYNLPHTATNKLNWGSRDTSIGTFEGWYEDASLTVPFDFTATMPDGKKFLYAKWAPIKYKVVIDPNGGELQSGDSTWFYLDAGEKVIEYTVTRKYRLDMHNGTFYYHHDLWDPVKDKHTDQYDPSTDGAPRGAYYTENIEEATTNEVSNPENRFSYEPGAYSFMGWYEVRDDGTVSLDPFNFSEPPNRPVTIRAIWRRTSVYTMKYESIDPDGAQDTEWVYDPELGVEGGYIDNGITMVGKDPTNYDREKWIWEGWHVVDVRNNYNPLTNIRSPGDIYVVHAEHADDRDNVIHFRAVYSLIESGVSRHIPEVVDFVLDSNDGGMLAAGQTVQEQDGRLGTYTDGAESSLGGLNAGVWFAGQQNNFSVNLADYSSTFAHENGYFLLGWDTNRVNDTMIPACYANETVGIDKDNADGNALYAVWEPQVYIDFVNDTGDALHNITLYIPSWTADGLFRVNEVSGTYQREVFSNFAEGAATFDLAAGETLRLVLPDAADRDFAIFGDSTYDEGTKLVITRSEPQIAGETTVPDEVFNAYAGEHYQVTGTMKISPTPVQVRFTKSTYPTSTTVPVRYFLHDKNGTVTEITQYSAAYWRSQNFKTSLTAGTASSDIAGMLRADSVAESIHELLSDNVRTNYGHTTIGIGVASAVITTDHETLHANEYRSITQEDASGGPYFRYYHEVLDWSRYSQVWNGYDDPAVYVVFYKRTPVHVTVGKTVVGSEEDKLRAFDFTAQITQHSTNIEYTVTTTYRQTRTLTAQTTSSKEPSASEWNNPDWSDPVAVSTNTSSATASSDQTQKLFESRNTEHISLADSERHPITIYYNNTEENVGEPVISPDEITSGGDTYTTSGGFLGFNKKYNHSKPQTNTWTQTVTYRIMYQYEVATIQEAETNAFALTGISGDGDSCKGTGNLSARTYTISSLSAPDAKGFFTYQSLDTAVFTNTRKTGSLTVSKTVVDGDAGDTFTFVVTLGETVVGKDSYTPPAGVHLGPFGKVFTFSLANGGSQTLTGLPAGATYTVEEHPSDKYIATVPANAAGTIVADATTTVGFTNTRKTDLSIAMKDRTVYFNGEEQHGCEITSVTGTGAALDTGDYTVTGLKAGHVLTVEHHVAAHGAAVGSYVGHFENARVTVHDSQDNDVTHTYIVTTTPGSLTIEATPIVVTITGNHEAKTYNGEEQSCDGYTFAITHAVTDDPIESGNIYVSIPPEYQQAFRTNVGRSDMYIQPNHVNVTVPEGVTVSNIVVAANGYIEITPAAATVTADGKAKILGGVDPVLTATVTGLFGADTVSYSLSRDVGEAVGTYTIRATGETEQGNYTVSYVEGAFTIQEVTVVQRATGSELPVKVAITASMLSALGIDVSDEHLPELVDNYLNQIDANGLRRWENLVTGTATNQLMLSTATSVNGAQTAVRMVNDPVGMMDLGYTVLHELRRKVGSGWNRVDGPKAGLNPPLTLDLLDEQGRSKNASGYYRVVTLLVPNHELSITNEIPSTNIIGVLEVTSTLKNTMTAVPWAALGYDPAENRPMSVSGLLRDGDLTAGDVINAMNASGTYERWTLEGVDEAIGDASGAIVNAWKEAAATIKDGEDGESIVSVTPKAASRDLSRDKVVWVTRNVNTTRPYFLIGQYSGEPIEVTVSGMTGTLKKGTMVPNPNLTAKSINSYGWGDSPAVGDVITIPGGPNLQWDSKNKVWYRSVMERDPSSSRPVRRTITDDEIPAGQGFWYYRKGGSPFTFTITPQKVDD